MSLDQESADQELVETAILSMKATANHVLSRIMDEDGRTAYTYAMKECIGLAALYGAPSLELLWKNIQDIQEEVESYKKQFSFFKKEKMARYYLMACDHAFDVITGLEKRFISGYPLGSDIKLIERKGLFTYEDKSVF